MEDSKYTQKALSVIQMSRAAGSTNGDIKNFLELEPINLAMIETFAIAGEDESRFDEIYESMLPIARTKLVEETLEAYGLRTSLSVDYKKIVRELQEIEKNGGREAGEPRTVAGESLIIATLLAIAKNPDEDFKSDKITKAIEDTYMVIFEELVDSLRKSQG